MSPHETPRVPLERGEALSQVPQVVHGFTSRIGGVSEGPLASLNLALREHERPGAVLENWRRVAAALHPELSIERIALLSQVHGAEVVRIDTPAGPLEPVASADAAFTTEPDLLLAVRTADCVPVLVAGPGVVGVAHSGWRGTAAGIVTELIAQITGALALDPSELTAAIGPCIGGPAYRVGPEVVEALAAIGLDPRDFLVEGAEAPHVDLSRAVAAQLAAAGIGAIDRSVRCTASDPELYSHRRDGAAAGRQAGVIARVSG